MAYLDQRRFDHRLLGAKEVQLKRDPVRLCCGGFFVLTLKKGTPEDTTPNVEGADDDAHEDAGFRPRTGDLM